MDERSFPWQTRLVIASTVAGLAAYDVYAIWRWGTNGSLSAAVLHYGTKYPVIPFLMGALTGHLLWYQDNPVLPSSR